jgi:MinD-like ATPase involved in chromosome partitioning or flagellar assembly
MDAISVAVALQSGEMASKIIGLVDGHPLLDFCGVARSVPDLLRLLDRFRPSVLLISPSILEDLEAAGTGPEDAPVLGAPLSFLLSGTEFNWGEKELARALHQPLRYCGLISRDVTGGEELFHQIKHKVDLYSFRDIPCSDPPVGEKRQDGSNRFVTVTGSKGGVGTTLISCTLAATLASTGCRVLLMDMDSDLSQLLHIKLKDEGKTVLDLLPLAEEMSWDLVRVSIHRHPAGFHLLPYGRRPEDPSRQDGAVTEPFLRNLLFLFDIVVLDFPRPLRRDFLPILHHSPMVLLVSLPDTLSANCARMAAAFLRRAGLDRRLLRLVVNRCGSHHALRPEELARAVGVELAAPLPHDDRSGMDFAELGEIPQDDSPLGRAVAGMAFSLGFEVALAGKPPALRRLKIQRKRSDQDLLRGGRP